MRKKCYRCIASRTATVLYMALILAGAGGLRGWAQHDSLPVSYQISVEELATSGYDMYSIYQQNDAVAIRAHMGNDPVSVGDLADPEERDRTFTAAMEETDWRLSSIASAADERFLVYFDELDSITEGERHFEDFRELYWSVEELNVSVERGDDDRSIDEYDAKHYVVKTEHVEHIYDESGELTEEESYEHETDLWFIEELPYAPSLFAPFQTEIDHSFISVNAGEADEERLNATIFEEIEDELKPLGLPAAVRQAGNDDAQRIEISDIERAEPHDLHLGELPRAPASEWSDISGIFWLVDFFDIGAEAERNSRAELALSTPSEEWASEELAAAYTIGDNDDFTVLIQDNGDDDDTRVFLFLSRPVHGLPEPGEYPVNPMHDAETLEEMDEEELEEASRTFYAGGFVQYRNDSEVQLMSLQGTDREAVTVEQSGDGGVTLQFDLAMDGMRFLPSNEQLDLELTGEVDAPEGLDSGDFTTPIGEHMSE